MEKSHCSGFNDKRITMNSGSKRLPVDILTIDFDVPMTLAICLVGRTERETKSHIEAFKAYLTELLQNHRMWERYDWQPITEKNR